MVVLITVVIVVLAGSALFSGAEAALLSISVSQVKVLAGKGARGAKNLSLIKENMYRPITVLVVFNNLFNIVGSMTVGFLAAGFLRSAQVGVVSAIFVFLIIFFGEIIPKSIGENHAASISLVIATPLLMFTKLLSPLLWVIGAITKPFRTNRNIVLAEEIKILTQLGHLEGSIEEDEKDMIHSVFDFSNRMAREVMVPRPDMITLTEGATVRDAIELTLEHGFSRIPVYDEGQAVVRGVLYTKDLVKQLHRGDIEQPVTGLLRDAFVVPETKPLDDLLVDFKKRKVHMAVVVDEYGTVAGLVTIEDLLEEIVGDIFDEFDYEFHREVDLVEELEDGYYRVDARVGIDDLGKMLEIDISGNEDMDTVGGLVLKALGHVPVVGEDFVYNGVSIAVESVIENRVSKVLLRVP